MAAGTVTWYKFGFLKKEACSKSVETDKMYKNGSMGGQLEDILGCKPMRVVGIEPRPGEDNCKLNLKFKEAKPFEIGAGESIGVDYDDKGLVKEVKDGGQTQIVAGKKNIDDQSIHRILAVTTKTTSGEERFEFSRGAVERAEKSGSKYKVHFEVSERLELEDQSLVEVKLTDSLLGMAPKAMLGSVPLIRFEEGQGTKIKIEDTVLDWLKDLPKPIRIVWVIGTGRTGKSTTCSRLSSLYLRQHFGIADADKNNMKCARFTAGALDEPVTKGVDCLPLPHAEGGSILLCDVEGTGMDTTATAKLFKLATLCYVLGSLVIHAVSSPGLEPLFKEICATLEMLEQAIPDSIMSRPSLCIVELRAGNADTGDHLESQLSDGSLEADAVKDFFPEGSREYVKLADFDNERGKTRYRNALVGLKKIIDDSKALKHQNEDASGQDIVAKLKQAVAILNDADADGNGFQPPSIFKLFENEAITRQLKEVKSAFTQIVTILDKCFYIEEKDIEAQLKGAQEVLLRYFEDKMKGIRRRGHAATAQAFYSFKPGEKTGITCDEKGRVLDITPDGVACAKGIKKGTHILKVNNKLEELRKSLHDAEDSGEAYELTVRQRNQAKENVPGEVIEDEERELAKWMKDQTRLCVTEAKNTLHKERERLLDDPKKEFEKFKSTNEEGTMDNLKAIEFTERTEEEKNKFTNHVEEKLTAMREQTIAKLKELLCCDLATPSKIGDAAGLVEEINRVLKKVENGNQQIERSMKEKIVEYNGFIDGHRKKFIEKYGPQLERWNTLTLNLNYLAEIAMALVAAFRCLEFKQLPQHRLSFFSNIMTVALAYLLFQTDKERSQDNSQQPADPENLNTHQVLLSTRVNDMARFLVMPYGRGMLLAALACLEANNSSIRMFTNVPEDKSEWRGWMFLIAALIILFVAIWDIAQHRLMPWPNLTPWLGREDLKSYIEESYETCNGLGFVLGFVNGMLILLSALIGVGDFFTLWKQVGFGGINRGFGFLFILDYAFNFILVIPALTICVVECKPQWGGRFGTYLPCLRERLSKKNIEEYKRKLAHYAQFLFTDYGRAGFFLFLACHSSMEARFYRSCFSGFYPQSWLNEIISWYCLILSFWSLLANCLSGTPQRSLCPDERSSRGHV